MSDDIDLDEGAPAEAAAPKKASGLASLLPNLLKFVAIGLAAIIFIITISVITVNVVNQGGRSVTSIPANSPFAGTRPTFHYFTLIGAVRTQTSDPVPFSVVVDVILGYDENDNATATELTNRLHELQDFLRRYFRGKRAEQLAPQEEARLKQEIMEQINTTILNTSRIRIVLFRQIDVNPMF